MIGAATYYIYQKNKESDLNFEVKSVVDII
jgi:hypothetical protein